MAEEEKPVTIAACHLSPEGVVLGADSATTLTNGLEGGICHLDYAQKVFEVGPTNSSIGLVTWGLGQVGQESHRTIVATVGYQHAKSPFSSLADMAQALASELWSRFTGAYSDDIDRVRALASKVNDRQASEEEFDDYRELVNRGSGGYCLAGRVEEHGRCNAIEVLWGPHLPGPTLRELPAEAPVFWGVPQIMERLVFGFDSPIIADIIRSGKWTGTEDELLDIVFGNQLMTPRLLPIREAVDWVHTVIHTTIRGTKFANWPHWCGGPVEIAVITTDRPFRWVRHKPLDAAIITTEEARR